MSEYLKKKQAAQPAQAKKAETVDPRREMTNGIPNSVLQDIFAGKRKADASMTGHSDTLAPSIAAKMSRAFGMDLSSVQISRSDKMKGTGMKGMAQGNKVVLSSDIDLNTMEGQAVLGHELSHIRAQSQGIGMGHGGLYENASLEHQADVEGMRAARGLFASREGGMEMGLGMSYGLGMKGLEGLTPLSGGMSASAGAPMQAKKPDSVLEANQMMYDYGQQRAGNLKLSNNPDELKKIQVNEDAALKKYAKSIGLPKGWLDQVKKEAKSKNPKDKAAQKQYIQQRKDTYYANLFKAGKGQLPVNRYDRIADEFDKEDAKRLENERNGITNTYYADNNQLFKEARKLSSSEFEKRLKENNDKRDNDWSALDKAHENARDTTLPKNPYAALEQAIKKAASMPKSEGEANEMMLAFAQNRAKDLKLDGKSWGELGEMEKEENRALEKYAESLPIPETLLKKWEDELKDSNEEDKKRSIGYKKQNYYDNLYHAGKGRLDFKKYPSLYDKFQKEFVSKANGWVNTYNEQITRVRDHPSGRIVDPENQLRIIHNNWNAKREELQNEGKARYQPKNPYQALEDAKEAAKRKELNKEGGEAPQEAPRQVDIGQPMSSEQLRQLIPLETIEQPAQQQAAPIKKKKKHWWWFW